VRLLPYRLHQPLDMGNNYSKPLARQEAGGLLDLDDLTRRGIDNHAMFVHHRKTVLLDLGTSMSSTVSGSVPPTTTAVAASDQDVAGMLPGRTDKRGRKTSTTEARDDPVPQGSPISSLLANLFMRVRTEAALA